MNTEKILVGNVEIINKDNLELLLKYTKDSQGKTWTIDDIDELFHNTEYDKLLETEKLKDLFYQFSVTEETESIITITAGIPPFIPMSPTIDWINLDLPEAYENVVMEQIHSSDFPIFYPDNKKESSEPVKIDKAVHKIAFIKKDQLLGTVDSDTTFQTGRDIFGKEIIPDKEFEPFYLNENLIIDGEKIYAGTTGFLRISSHWAQLLPYESYGWSIKMHKKHCFFNFYPGEDHLYPDPNIIYNYLSEQDVFAEDLLPESLFEMKLRQAAAKKKEIHQLPLLNHPEPIIEIETEENGAKAFLFIKVDENNRKSLTLNEIGQRIKQSKLKKLNFAQLKKDLIEFYKSDALVLMDYLLSEGVPPSRGTDREISFNLDFMDETETVELQQRLLQSDDIAGYTSYKQFPSDAIQKFALVNEGQVLGKLDSPKPGKPGIDVYGNSIPAIPGNDPVIHLFEGLHFAKNTIIADAEGVLDQAIIHGEYFLRIRTHKNAAIEVKVDENSMNVWINLHKEEGSGLPMTRKKLLHALDSENIVKGIMDEKVEAALDLYRKGELVLNFPIAEGKAPKDRIDRLIKFNIDLSSEREVYTDASGKADFKHPKKNIPLKKDDLIGTIIPINDEESNGYNVHGEIIPSKSNETINIEFGANVYQKEIENGGIEIYAAKNGAFFSSKNKIDVIDRKVIKGDLDYSTGNVKFPGSVIIKGSVLSGFYIVAGENISVGEVVQASLLSATGAVNIKGGIKGENKAVVSSKKTICCSFAEQAHLMASDTITIQKTCLRSKVRSNGMLKLLTPKSRIIGGQIKVKRGLEVFSLGNESETKTFVSFGQDYIIEDRIRLEEKEIQKIKDEIAKIDELMKKYEHSNLKENLIQVRQRKLKYFKILEKRNIRLFNLNEKFEEHFDSRIVVKGAIYPGVIIESHGRTIEFNEKQTSISIIFNQNTGHIEQKPL